MTLTDEQRELLEDKFTVWARQAESGPLDLRDYNRRAADALKAALMAASEACAPPAVWLIEWPATRQDVVRYWHPIEGRVIDPNHSIRFARREDAEAVIKRDHIVAGARPVEHLWLPPQPPSEG